MKRPLIAFTFLLLGAGLLGVRPVRTVHAQTGCSASTFSGAYGYTFTGTYYDNQGYVYYLSLVGRMVPDGNGNLTGSDAGSNDGTALSRTFTGTYTVNSDCTGTATLTLSNNSKSAMAFVLVSGGKEVNFSNQDAGFIYGGVAKLQ